MRSLTEIPSLAGKKVLVRAEYDVPLVDGKVTETNAARITASFPTIDYLAATGARVIILSHIGRDGGSLAPVADYINETGRSCAFVDDILGAKAQQAIGDMVSGDILLLENVRTDAREEVNDEQFAQELARLGEFFINEAFSASHREHASIVGIPRFLPSAMGYRFEQEYESLGRFETVEHPCVVVIGGSKFETKLPLIETFLTIADTIIVGGALTNTLLAKRGYPVGKSIVDAEADVSSIITSPRVFLPDRVIVERGGGIEVAVQDVGSDDVIVDISPNSLDRIASSIRDAKMVLWNGPLGWYEKGFTAGSEKLVSLIQSSKSYSVVGGGDTVSLLHEKKRAGAFSFVSLSGGAMLEFLAERTLPGIDALG